MARTILKRSNEGRKIETVQIRCINDRIKEDGDSTCRYIRPYMKTGWVTWISKDYWESEQQKKRGTAIVENNKYGINFPISSFELCALYKIY